jgi:hypothetical protein
MGFWSNLGKGLKAIATNDVVQMGVGMANPAAGAVLNRIESQLEKQPRVMGANVYTAADRLRDQQTYEMVAAMFEALQRGDK